jgi:hypothetical protein
MIIQHKAETSAKHVPGRSLTFNIGNTESFGARQVLLPFWETLPREKTA